MPAGSRSLIGLEATRRQKGRSEEKVSVLRGRVPSRLFLRLIVVFIFSAK